MTLRSVPVRLRRRRPVPQAGGGDGPACRAPFVSMYLDQHGGVRACCQNTHFPLGYINESSLADIWHGERNRRLRRALEGGDLSLGCEFCEWQVADGHPQRAYARWYDEFPVDVADPEWPRQLELSISNTCNLQCAMCNGDWSSSIRSQREHRSPLPVVYDDAFFEGLRPFLPHLERVKILGGEPFLAQETLRVLDLLADTGSEARVHVTTNGTQWTPRVERILERVRVDVTVSVDGATPATYERIRAGATWLGLQENLARFQEVSRRRGTDLSLTFCLMMDNWDEFIGVCRMADERGIGMGVNTVTHPPEMSLFRLGLPELDVVISGLEDQDRTSGHLLGDSARVFHDELDRLRRHREVLAGGGAVDMLAKRDLDPSDQRNGALVGAPERLDGAPLVVVNPSRVRAQIDDVLAEEDPFPAGTSWIDLDLDHRVVASGGAPLPTATPAAELVGVGVDDLNDVLAEDLGGMAAMEHFDVVARVRVDWSGREFVHEEWNLQRYECRMGDGSRVVTVSAPRMDDDGTLVGTRLHVGHRPVGP